MIVRTGRRLHGTKPGARVRHGRRTRAVISTVSSTLYVLHGMHRSKQRKASSSPIRGWFPRGRGNARFSPGHGKRGKVANQVCYGRNAASPATCGRDREWGCSPPRLLKFCGNIVCQPARCTGSGGGGRGLASWYTLTYTECHTRGKMWYDSGGMDYV